MKSKSKLGWILLSGASLAALGAVSPAFAQDDDVSDEIVVTATGRTAAIQDVPIAVTAIGGDTLENTGVQDLRDVTQVAPSLVIGTGQSNSSGTLVSIRGIGTGSDNPGFEGAVGIFIDGVYRARAGAALADLPELERVEILRGPQGTLFGRNTSAGAISVISAGPDFEPGMYIEGLLGLDDTEEGGLRAGVNVPMGDSFAFRVDGTIRQRDGYITDVTSGDDLNTTDRYSLRGQAIWDLSPDASLRVIVDSAESDEVCCGVTPLVYGSTQGIIQLITGGTGTPPGFVGGALPASFAGATNSRIEEREMTVTPGRGYGEQTEDFGASGELNWDIGNINVTSITAFRDWSAERDQDVDFTSADIAYRDGLEVSIETFTQEVRFQGEFGRVNWLAGLFYGDETIDTTDRIRVGSQVGAYTSTASVANTDAFVPGANNGCELIDYTPGATFPSIFQCIDGLIEPGAGPLSTAVNGTNGGYLLPAASGQGQQNDNWNVETQTMSVFTHNEIALSPALTLTLGLRYNQDTKDVTADLNATNTTCDSLRLMETNTLGLTGAGPNAGIVTTILFLDPDGPGPASAGALSSLMNLACNPAVNPIANGDYEGSREENEFSGTASLAYDLSDDLMVYAGYSRGYKAGGYNLDRSGFDITPATLVAPVGLSDLEFEPEFTDAYEIGLKSTLFGGTTTANVALFYQQIHDYQSNNFNGFNFITQNVPEVISQGVEFELNARPIDGLNINAGVVYTDAYYDSTVVFNPIDPGPNTIRSGDPLSGAGAAEYTVTGGVSYEMPITSGMSALFYLDGRWNSGYRTQTLARNPASDNDSFAIFNGRISLRDNNEHWSIDLWGQNLTDEFYYVGAFQPPLQSTTVIYPNAPQTWGITIRAQY